MGEGGFALAIVVLLLFAIGVAGATGYQVARTESRMSLTGQQGSRAFAMAQSGLQRFMGEETDTIPVERTFTDGNARTVVTPRRLTDDVFRNRLYLLTSQGTFVDPRMSGNAAERTVHRMAYHQRTPMHVLGGLMTASRHVKLNGRVRIRGRDQAQSWQCPEAGRVDVAGVAGADTISVSGASVSGSPPADTVGGSPSLMLDALGLDWAALTAPEPEFQVDYDYGDGFPSFWWLPADAYPVIRRSGTFNAYWWRDGRGVLIVDGTLILHDWFDWDGLIIADRIANPTRNRDFTIRGALIVDPDGSGSPVTIEGSSSSDWISIYFHSCHLLQATAKLAQLEPLSRTWWEGF